MPNFGLVVYRDRAVDGVEVPGARAFVVQKNGRRETIGRAPPWTLEEARKEARRRLVAADRGDPVAPTVRAAIERYVVAMRAKGCSPRSIEDVRVDAARELPLDRRLDELTPDEAVSLHQRLTRRGPYLANRVLRSLRAVYNLAARRVSLPPNPVRAVVFNRERRRREPLLWSPDPGKPGRMTLAEWKASVDAVPNRVRADLFLFVLFTGLRSTDARAVRWEEVDLGRATMRRPSPKGGADRAFAVPLSGAALEVLRRRRAENTGDEGWAFPAVDNRGRVVPIVNPKEPDPLAPGRLLPSPHRLRDTFVSAAYEAGVPEHAIKALANHRLPGGDVTLGYYEPSVEHLRAAAERVAAFLLERMALPA
jgi:integrase